MSAAAAAEGLCGINLPHESWLAAHAGLFSCCCIAVRWRVRASADVLGAAGCCWGPSGFITQEQQVPVCIDYLQLRPATDCMVAYQSPMQRQCQACSLCGSSVAACCRGSRCWPLVLLWQVILRHCPQRCCRCCSSCIYQHRCCWLQGLRLSAQALKPEIPRRLLLWHSCPGVPGADAWLVHTIAVSCCCIRCVAQGDASGS